MVSVWLAVLAVFPLRALTLIEDGGSRYTIVLPEQPSAPEETAARELRMFLAQATGVTLPVALGTAPGPAIRVGGAYPGERPAPDAVVIKTDGEELILAGEGKRGTLYAVYAFLERYAGIRFWAPGETEVPSLPVLEIPAVDYEYAPPFEVREMGCGIFTADPVFAARSRINGHWEAIPEAYGGHESLLGWCHTFELLLPSERYFAGHPEWYALVDGMRNPGQLCLSNREMRRALASEVLRWLRENPGTRVISVSQNDNEMYCRCEPCRALDARYGGVQSGILLDCVNEVAAAVAAEFPEVWVETLAYWYTIAIPEGIRPRDNVLIRLCSIRANVGKPLASKENESFFRNLQAWSSVSRQLAFWNYVANFSSYLSPHPNLRHLADDLRLFRDHRVRWVFEHGGSRLEDFAEMRAWLVAKLLWNPDLDLAALQREFLAGYYGAAALYLEEYWRLLHDELDHSGFAATCYIESSAAWLRFPVLLQAEALLRQAQEAVAGDPVLLRRVGKAKSAVNYALLTREESYSDAGVPLEQLRSALAELSAAAEAYSADGYREGLSFAALLPELRAVVGLDAPAENRKLPPELQALPAESVQVIDADRCMLWRLNSGVWLSPDAMAETASGMAARMPGSHSDWLVQYRPVPIWVESRGAWEVYASLRVKMPEAARKRDTPVVELGIHDGKKGTSQKLLLPGSAVPEEAYSCIRVGTLSSKDEYIYVAPVLSGDTVNIWVERIFLVKRD